MTIESRAQIALSFDHDQLLREVKQSLPGLPELWPPGLVGASVAAHEFTCQVVRDLLTELQTRTRDLERLEAAVEATVSEHYAGLIFDEVAG